MLYQIAAARCLRHHRRPYTSCTRNIGMKTSGKQAQGSSLMKRFRSFPMFVASTHYKRFNFLFTRTTLLDLRNLFNQVHEHFGRQSPLTLESESKTGGVHSTRYTSEPPVFEEETYYIVRLRTHHRKKYSGRARVVIELLLRNSDNYLVAWRLIHEAADYKTAYWCLFTDTRTLNQKGLLKNKCKHTKYTNGYRKHLGKVKIYDKFLLDAE